MFAVTYELRIKLIFLEEFGEVAKDMKNKNKILKSIEIEIVFFKNKT